MGRNVEEAAWRSWRSPLAAMLASAAVLVAGLVQAQNAPALPRKSEAEGLAAWSRVQPVLQHPRCMNCHQADSPLQGDAARAHVPHVVRGVDNHGVAAMRCTNCHGERNNPNSGAPGALHWQLAPVSMLWQGLSGGDLCRMLKDRARNGNRSPADLVHHMGFQGDPLVLWGWQPGEGRQPIPVSHQEFIDQLTIWAGADAPCPR